MEAVLASVFLTGGGQFLFVECSSGRVAEWSSGAPVEELYLSVHTMLKTFLEAYETGAFFLAEGRLERDEDALREIGKRHNPGIERWKQGW